MKMSLRAKVKQSLAKIATSRLLAGLAMTVFLFGFTVNFTPAFAQAPDTGLTNFTTLVPGAGDDPGSEAGKKYASGDYTLCDFFRLLANAVKILFELAAGGAIFLFLWTAFGMISNWGEGEKAQGAFKNLKNIFYGLAIMIGAWFLVNVLIVTLTAKYDDKGAAKVFDKPWNNLEGICKDL